MYHRFRDSLSYAGFGYPAHFITLFCLLPFITILLHALLCLVASTRLIRFVPKLVSKTVAEVEFWFRSGRTVFSIPFLLLMLLPFYLQVHFIKGEFRGSGRGRPDVKDLWILWKEPLEDQLYII